MWNLIKMNPWKAAIALAALISAVAAVIAGANYALGQAKQAGRDEVQALWNAEKAGAAMASAAYTKGLSDYLSRLDGTLQATLARQGQQGQVITNTIEKETIREPRYSSPECSVSGSVLDAINAARRLSHPAATSPDAGEAVSARSGPG